MGVHHFQQMMGEAGKLGFELELDTCSEKGRAFEQALDIRIRNLKAVHRQTAGNLRELLRELASHLPEMPEFLIVEMQQPRIHANFICSVRTVQPVRFPDPAWS